VHLSQTPAGHQRQVLGLAHRVDVGRAIFLAQPQPGLERFDRARIGQADRPLAARRVEADDAGAVAVQIRLELPVARDSTQREAVHLRRVVEDLGDTLDLIPRGGGDQTFLVEQVSAVEEQLDVAIDRQAVQRAICRGVVQSFVPARRRVVLDHVWV